MFTCLTVTLRKTVIKPNFAKILHFSLKKGGSQAGVYPISTPAGSRRVPLLSTPLFLLGKRKITAQSGFPTVSRNCNWKKVKQKTILVPRLLGLGVAESKSSDLLPTLESMLTNEAEMIFAFQHKQAYPVCGVWT